MGTGSDQEGVTAPSGDSPTSQDTSDLFAEGLEAVKGNRKVKP